MFTDGKIHEVGWFEDVIEPVTVKEDQYDQEFANGLYEFAHPEILSGTEIITVRYKTPEDVLLWLDNIPVMRDGYGVTGVINWYLATSQEEVTTDNAGWTASFQDINANKKYLWNYEAVKYTSNKLVKTTPRIIARWTSGEGAIKDITEYYLISEQETGVSSADSGWSQELVSFNQDKPYLWNYERVEYSTGETSTTSPRVLGFYGQGVQGDKGDKGDKGDTGAKGDKGGQYWGINKPASPVKGDTYLDVQRMYLMEYNGTTWTTVPYTDSRYNVAVQDIIASAQSSGQLMQIANAWVANLVAGTVLANQLMAKNLTVLDGGSIQSENYSQGVRGWKIDSNGFAEFENGIFRGEVNANAGVFNNVTINENCTVKGALRQLDGQECKTFFLGSVGWWQGVSEVYNYINSKLVKTNTLYKIYGQMNEGSLDGTRREFMMNHVIKRAGYIEIYYNFRNSVIEIHPTSITIPRAPEVWELVITL